jgi:hypothetical protein
MECNVCGGNAEQVNTATNGITVVCPSCGEYDVSSAVIATGQLWKLEPARRRDLLEQAKHAAEPGVRPVITTYLLG